MSDAKTTTDRRPAAAVLLADLPRHLRLDANEINGWGAGNEAEHIRQAASEIDCLRARLLRIRSYGKKVGNKWLVDECNEALHNDD